jgi:energy-converting hydrogenase Eha subunit A
MNIVVGLPVTDDNPLRNPYKLSISKAQPVFDVAIDDIVDKFKVLPWSGQHI